MRALALDSYAWRTYPMRTERSWHINGANLVVVVDVANEPFAVVLSTTSWALRSDVMCAVSRINRSRRCVVERFVIAKAMLKVQLSGAGEITVVPS